MKQEIKLNDNTPIEEINIRTNPVTKTMIERYLFASSYCYNKDVLDCPTGMGYGMGILHSLGAKSVSGYDIDKNAINYIEKKYDNMFPIFNKNMTKPWIHEIDVCDTLVSLEGFEHVERSDVKKMLENFKLATKKGGKIIISTPRRKIDVWVDNGSTHRYEYKLPEFMEELRKVFKGKIEIFFGMEFKLPGMKGFHTEFVQDMNLYERSNVMIAVIDND